RRPARGPRKLGDVLGGRARFDAAARAGDLRNRARELVPRALAAVGDVEGAEAVLAQELERALREVFGARRSADLIAHDLELLARARQLAHGEHEVLAPGRVQPTRAHEQMARARALEQG